MQVLDINFGTNEKDFRISYGDGTSSIATTTPYGPEVAAHLYNAPGQYTINITGYAITLKGENITASASLDITILPFAPPVLTISTSKSYYKVNESIPIALTLTNMESKAVNITEMNITSSSLYFYIRIPSDVVITERGPRVGASSGRVLAPYGQYNETVTITDDMWKFGYDYDFTQTGEYSIQVIYEVRSGNLGYWLGKCTSNTITFEIIE
jgi:hypothetical protein